MERKEIEKMVKEYSTQLACIYQKLDAAVQTDDSELTISEAETLQHEARRIWVAARHLSGLYSSMRD